MNEIEHKYKFSVKAFAPVKASRKHVDEINTKGQFH